MKRFPLLLVAIVLVGCSEPQQTKTDELRTLSDAESRAAIKEYNACEYRCYQRTMWALGVLLVLMVIKLPLAFLLDKERQKHGNLVKLLPLLLLLCGCVYKPAGETCHCAPMGFSVPHGPNGRLGTETHYPIPNPF